MDGAAICQAAQEVVRKAGLFVREKYGAVRESDIQEKSLNSLVSYVDKEAEKILVHGLGNILPEAGFLTEEDTVENQSGGLRWVIDPLDGTTNFLYHLPVFAVSVALVDEDNLVQVGLVFDIMSDDLYYAWLNGGAYRNGDRITVSGLTEPTSSLVATGFHYHDFSRIDAHLKAVKYFIEHTRGIRRLGSAAIDLAYTACGRFDGFYEYSLNPWDVAGGALLVREAGGRVTDFSGGDNFLFGGEILASSEAFYNPFQKKISHFFNS